MNARTSTRGIPEWLVALAFILGAASPVVSAGSADTGVLEGRNGPLPSPRLSPQEVVRIQLEALRGNDESDRGIAVCFRFASPSNKVNTGPLPRFAQMIKDGAYRLMLEYIDAEFEPAEIVDDVARQVVRLIGPSRAITYAFYLSRQGAGDCEGCWMTDAVTVERIEDSA